MIKKWDISLGKFKNRGTPKNGALSIKIGYTVVFLSRKMKKKDKQMGYQPQKVQKKSNSKNGALSTKIRYTSVFSSRKKNQKMGYQPQKVQKKRNSKNGVNTAQRPLFQKLWEIFRKKQILMPILRQKVSE